MLGASGAKESSGACDSHDSSILLEAYVRGFWVFGGVVYSDMLQVFKELKAITVTR